MSVEEQEEYAEDEETVDEEIEVLFRAGEEPIKRRK